MYTVRFKKNNVYKMDTYAKHTVLKRYKVHQVWRTAGMALQEQEVIFILPFGNFQALTENVEEQDVGWERVWA
jgi:hypothetical protein